MAVCATALRSEEVALADLGGVDFQHEVRLSVPDWTAWTHVSERLCGAGAEVHALQLTRVCAGFDVRCRLKAVSAEAARGLVHGLLNEGVAQRGVVEHLVLRARSTP